MHMGIGQSGNRRAALKVDGLCFRSREAPYVVGISGRDNARTGTGKRLASRTIARESSDLAVVKN
jgi:hypothetical protein